MDASKDYRDHSVFTPASHQKEPKVWSTTTSKPYRKQYEKAPSPSESTYVQQYTVQTPMHVKNIGTHLKPNTETHNCLLVALLEEDHTSSPALDNT